jgi:hypothetical protein
VVDILSLDEDDHEQILFSMIDVHQFLLCAKMDIASMIDIGFIAEIEIFEIVVGIENIFVEHVSKDILFSSESSIFNLDENAFVIDPSLAVIGEADPFMAAEFVAKKGHFTVV